MSVKSELPLSPSTGSLQSFDPRRYQPTLPRLPEMARQVFRDYSHIPEDKILDHIYQVRDKAWKMKVSSTFQGCTGTEESHLERPSLPYPCIGVFQFLDFGANLSPIYPEVVRRVRDGDTFLDLGCCFGQDIRKLVSDGAPSENIIGADSEGQFTELEYELFQDRETLKSRFYTASIFDDDFLADWHGKVDIIYIGAFLHLFDFDRQKKIVAQLVKLLRKKPGSLVFGRNIAAEKAGNFRMESFDWAYFGIVLRR